jgi:hypothetical protein
VTEDALAMRVLRLRREHVQVGVLAVAVAAAAVVVAALALRSGGGKPGALPSVNGGPALVSEAQLHRLAAQSAEPVYWAGTRKGYSYELTRTSTGRVYVRYLPAGVRAGDPRSGFLVVGTYTQPGSFADLQHAAKQPGALSVRISHGGLVVFSSRKPTSVYLGYPGTRYQVEVYAPSSDTARQLVLAGTIRPIR